MSEDVIEREITIDAPRERVWEVLTQAGHLGRWFGDAGAEVDLEPGGALTLRWEEHGEVHGRVERVQAPNAFAFRWFSWGWMDETDPALAVEGNSTLVEFTLEDAGEHTLLHVRESGFAALDTDESRRAEVRDGNVAGWEIELGHLADHLTSVRG